MNQIEKREKLSLTPRPAPGGGYAYAFRISIVHVVIIKSDEFFVDE